MYKRCLNKVDSAGESFVVVRCCRRTLLAVAAVLLPLFYQFLVATSGFLSPVYREGGSSPLPS